MEDDRTGGATGDAHWRSGDLDAMDDAEVAHAARAGFAWYRRVLADPGHSPEPAAFARLVALQREYLQRFPAGDLSARPAGGGGAPWVGLVGA